MVPYQDSTALPFDRSCIDIETMDSDEGTVTVSFVNVYSDDDGDANTVDDCLESVVLMYTNENSEEVC